MGVFEYEDDGSDQDGSSPIRAGNPRELGYFTRPVGMSSSGDHQSSSQILPGDAQKLGGLNSAAELLNESTSQDSVVDGGVGARCKWREDGFQCTVVLDSLQGRL